MPSLRVSPLKQRGRRDCMLTCLQMAVQFRTGEVLTTEQLRNDLGHNSAVNYKELLHLAIKYQLSPLICGDLELKFYGSLTTDASDSSIVAKSIESTKYFPDPKSTLNYIQMHLRDQRPTIALVRPDDPAISIGHAVLVIGMTETSVILVDPAVGSRSEWKVDEFLDRWHAYSCFSMICLIPSETGDRRGCMSIFVRSRNRAK